MMKDIKSHEPNHVPVKEKEVVTITNADAENLIPIGDVVASCHTECVVPVAGYCAIFATAYRDFKFGRKTIRAKLIREAYPQNKVLDEQCAPWTVVGPKSGNRYEVKLADTFKDSPFGKYYQELLDAAGAAFEDWKNA